MKSKFKQVLDNFIIPFFETNGFKTMDINSETNKTLGVESYYFYKIDGDLNRNFYFESNFDNNENKYEFKIDFGIYSVSFNETIGFPIYDSPNGTANTFSIAAEELSADNQYWQTITAITDFEIFSNALLQRIQNTLNIHKNINILDDLIDFYFDKKVFYCNYDYMIRYLKNTNKQVQLNNYVSILKSQNSDGSESSLWFLKQLDASLDTRTLKEKVTSNFTKGIEMPIAWSKVLEWAETNTHTVISGSFELCDNSNELLTHIVDVNSNAIKHLAIIGTNSADEVFCIWQKDENIKPIVFLGEAGRAKVIANSIDDFIDLLAIGYEDVEIADYSNMPEFSSDNEYLKNSIFQTFYKATFVREITKTGANILANNTITNSEFFLWMCDNDSIWKEWNT